MFKTIQGKLIEIQDLLGETIEDKIYNMLDEYDKKRFKIKKEHKHFNLFDITEIENRYDCFIEADYNKIFKVYCYIKEDMFKNYMLLNHDNTIFFSIPEENSYIGDLNDKLHSLILETKILEKENNNE